MTSPRILHIFIAVSLGLSIAPSASPFQFCVYEYRNKHLVAKEQFLSSTHGYKNRNSLKSPLFVSSVANNYPSDSSSSSNSNDCSPEKNESSSSMHDEQHNSRSRRVFISPQRDPVISVSGREIILKLKKMISFIANRFVLWISQRNSSKGNVDQAQIDRTKKNIDIRMLPNLAQLQDPYIPPKTEVIIDTTVEENDSTKPTVHITRRTIKKGEQLPSFLQSSSTALNASTNSNQNHDSEDYDPNLQCQLYVKGNYYKQNTDDDDMDLGSFE